MKIYMKFLLMSMFMCSLIQVSGSEFIPVRAELNDTVTLPCSRRCSGLVRWTVFRTRVPVSQCDQTSCSSLKDGFMMSHDQYMKGNLSLIITGADYRKKNMYTCDCDGSEICDVILHINSVDYHREVKVGGSLMLSVPVQKEVKVEFRSHDDDVPQSSVPVCTVKDHDYQCEPDYNKRASLKTSASLHLNQLKISDSGVYTVLYTDPKEIISTYKVTVSGSRLIRSLNSGEPSSSEVKVNEEEEVQCADPGVPVWVVVLVVLLVVSVVVLVLVILYLLKKVHHLQMKHPEDSSGSHQLNRVSDQSTHLNGVNS